MSVSLKKIKEKNDKTLNIFQPNGSIFIIKKSDLYRYKNFINTKSFPFIINNKEALDIDFPKDWTKAVKYLKRIILNY